MIFLSMVATRAREIEASSVPEIIGGRFGQVARTLAVVSLVVAYMVIVSYQFNAGGAVLEVITGDKPAVPLAVGHRLTRDQLRDGRLFYVAPSDWRGEAKLLLETADVDSRSDGSLTFTVQVVGSSTWRSAVTSKAQTPHTAVVRPDRVTRLRFDTDRLRAETYVVRALPQRGGVELREPILTARVATAIAAAFIITFAALAGLMSLAYADIVTGSIITLSVVVALPVFWLRAGGWTGIEASFTAMGDRPYHMQVSGVYSPTQLVNYCLPVILLVLGDANQYQRIFASRNARGARAAVTAMIFIAFAIELLIILNAWVASSMTPDPEDGKYILIHAAKHYLPLPLGCLFMVTVVGIIVSTADSFLLVPATTFVHDIYLNYVDPRASQRRIVWISRLLVVVFGVIAYLVSLAFAESTGFFRKALYAFTIYGASITPSLVAAITWRRATTAGAITSIFAGTVVSLAWGELDPLTGWLPPAVAELDAVLPAAMVSVLCLVVVSLATQNKE
jgi:Na+/proline symporter